MTMKRILSAGLIFLANTLWLQAGYKGVELKFTDDAQPIEIGVNPEFEITYSDNRLLFGDFEVLVEQLSSWRYIETLSESVPTSVERIPVIVFDSETLRSEGEEEMQLYTIDGLKVGEGREIFVPRTGIYVVKIGKRSVKIKYLLR